MCIARTYGRLKLLPPDSGDLFPKASVTEVRRANKWWDQEQEWETGSKFLKMESKNWCFWAIVVGTTLESLGLQGDRTRQHWRKSTLNIHWKDWCWSWSFNTLATSCEELTHWKRPWCWERERAGREGGYRGWDGWMASQLKWTWVWANSGR